jgi:hypothetical protein
MMYTWRKEGMREGVQRGDGMGCREEDKRRRVRDDEDRGQGTHASSRSIPS